MRSEERNQAARRGPIGTARATRPQHPRHCRAAMWPLWSRSDHAAYGGKSTTTCRVPCRAVEATSQTGAETPRRRTTWEIVAAAARAIHAERNPTTLKAWIADHARV